MTNIKDIIIKDEKVFPILKIAGEIGEQYNLKVFVVGGFVRDLFLNRKSVEIDLMVEGDGIRFSRLLADKLGVKKIVTFKKFGTAKIPYPIMQIEVASARLEDYDKSSRKPKKVKYTDIFGDLKRRDFTINAMAVDLLPNAFGDLYDPYNGIADLKAKHLITPLDPDETFSEDPLRMMRAAVFASRFDLQINDDGLKSMQKHADRIQIVSRERITAELIKIL